MHVYVHNVLLAMMTFPLVAAVVTLPYLIYQYRRYGRVPAWKSLCVYLFVFYLICAYYMVILPLPADRHADYGRAPYLVPFGFVRGMVASAGISLSDPQTWLAALRKPAVYTVLFNVALTVPLGFFAGLVCKARWWQATLAGFALSLFFEVTQISGLYGIYDHPYRQFDVNDLITNTAGALLGFWCYLPARRLLPDMDDVNVEARRDARAFTSATHRLVGFSVDAALSLALTLGAAWIGHMLRPTAGTAKVSFLAAALATGFVFMIVPLLTRGRTPGHLLVRLRVVRPDGSPAAWWRIALRYALLVWVLTLVPLWFGRHSVALLLSGSDGAEAGFLAGYLVVLYFMAWLLSLLVRGVLSAFRVPFVMLNGLVSGTRVMSEGQIAACRAARACEARRMRADRAL